MRDDSQGLAEILKAYFPQGVRLKMELYKKEKIGARLLKELEKMPS